MTEVRPRKRASATPYLSGKFNSPPTLLSTSIALSGVSKWWEVLATRSHRVLICRLQLSLARNARSHARTLARIARNSQTHARTQFFITLYQSHIFTCAQLSFITLLSLSPSHLSLSSLSLISLSLSSLSPSHLFSSSASSLVFFCLLSLSVSLSYLIPSLSLTPLSSHPSPPSHPPSSFSLVLHRSLISPSCRIYTNLPTTSTREKHNINNHAFLGGMWYQ